MDDLLIPSQNEAEGLTSYFRKFIPNYARIARPLSDLLRDNVKFKFGPTEIASFQELKNILSENPVLHVFQQGYPFKTPHRCKLLGFGAVLLQKSDDGLFHPIHYFSRKTTVQQEKYSSYELEVLAIIEALKKFRSYLLGTKFKIITDCDAFQKTMHKKDLPAKIARWALMLEEFDYEVCHRPGRQMKHVDALSRYPIMMISSHDITQKIKEAQNKDEFISQLKSTIKITPSDEYFLKNEILYKLHKNSELLVVPEMMQREIVLHAHAQGHFASKKTESIVSKEFYIPRLTKIVQDVITNCVPCILSSRKAGPLPSTKKCYKHLFTVINSFSKFVWIYPVKSTSTKDALDKLILQQTIFGNPSKIITDKGSAFTSTEFQKFCQEESIEHVQITTGVPRGNGQIERMHETIIPVLTKLTIEEPEKWFKHVHRLQRIMNSTTTRSTKFTPFEVLIGVKMKQKEDLQIKHLLEEELGEKFINKRETLRNEAKENILRLQAENKKQYNKHRKPAYNYKPGDTVAIQRTQFGTGLKLRPKYFGPYEVTKVNKHDRYEVQKIGQHEGPNVTSTSADKMKKWFHLFPSAEDGVVIRMPVWISATRRPLPKPYRTEVTRDGDRFNSFQVIYSQFGLTIHQNDHQARRRFVEWAPNEIAVVPDFHKRILFSDEAHFWLNGYVNKQNCRIWSEANPHVYVETPLHPEKLTVWCAFWAGGILLQKR
ncbi:transposon Tf2-9 polyprotein [Trichonephila clavipes]|uniref:RNA-directed DNA polymerase n=1 Tax=Trichonephila clavipes TaxID=2585209 RepID=A0A8X6RK81_TRICX|nr:transposon Tf2-9 polyprotein [Trichonephila clavipes]